MVKRLLFFSILLMAGALFQPPGFAEDRTQELMAEGDQCVICHVENEILPEHFSREDIHLQQGLSCAGCHGGDPRAEDQEEAMSRRKGFIGVPKRDEIPQFCGKCHSHIDFMRTYQPRIPTDQVEQYYTSIHGQRLKKGDENVAECASCHTAHAILPVKDPRSSVYPLQVPATCNTCHGNQELMSRYNLPVDPYEKYARSVHGQALLEKKDVGAPACNDCHGNHGATPPGVQSVSHVCGSCHVNNMNYFTASKMGAVFQEQGMHACEQCHNHHEVLKTSDEMIGVGENSTCTQCHSEGDAGYRAAQQIYQTITTFADSLALADSLLKDVQKKGMDDVEILFALQEANQALIHSRTLVHTFDPEKVKAKIGEGAVQVRKAVQLAADEIRDFHNRRRGFGVAILFIAILAVGLYLKIREMEKET